MSSLEPRHLMTIQRILEEFIPEREVRMFGSRAKGIARPSSDVDLAIMGDARVNARSLSSLRYAFEESDLPFRVDIVEWVTASPDFKAVILASSEIVQTKRS